MEDNYSYKGVLISFWMVEAYLMHAKPPFVRFVDALSLAVDGNNYQVYIPEKGAVIGYFADQNLELSEKRFCDTDLNTNKKNRLDSKVKEEKFIKKFDINNSLVEIILNSSKDLERDKVTFNTNLETFSNVCKFPKK